MSRSLCDVVICDVPVEITPFVKRTLDNIFQVFEISNNVLIKYNVEVDINACGKKKT